MNNFDEIFTNREDKTEFPNNITGFVDIMCDQCHVSADEAFYNKELKKVKLVCKDHESIMDIDLTWLVSGN